VIVITRSDVPPLLRDENKKGRREEEGGEGWKVKENRNNRKGEEEYRKK
jgi:hypothetical protein